MSAPTRHSRPPSKPQYRYPYPQICGKRPSRQRCQPEEVSISRIFPCPDCGTPTNHMRYIGHITTCPARPLGDIPPITDPIQLSLLGPACIESYNAYRETVAEAMKTPEGRARLRESTDRNRIQIDRQPFHQLDRGREPHDEGICTCEDNPGTQPQASERRPSTSKSCEKSGT